MAVHPILSISMALLYFYNVGLEPSSSVNNPRLLQQSNKFPIQNYYISINPAAFKDAKKDCETHFSNQGRRGTLLYLESVEELRFILEELEDYGSGRKYWIGGTYANQRWVWIHDYGNVPSFARPTPGDHTDRSRIALVPKGKFDGTFVDAQDSQPNRYICKALARDDINPTTENPKPTTDTTKRTTEDTTSRTTPKPDPICDVLESDSLTESCTNRRKHYFAPSLTSQKRGSYADNIAYCRKCGGEMVSVMSDSENNYIHKWLRTEADVVPPGAWLGGTVVNLNPAFEWRNGNPRTYGTFCPGEPNEGGTTCLHIAYDTTRNCWWNYPCTAKHFFMICQIYETTKRDGQSCGA